MILFRYLAKEVGTTLIALTSILVLIFMSNQVVIYLNRAANGHIPGMLVFQLLMLELPNLLSLLLPLGFYFAILVAYGRLYADSEIVVLQACGYSPGKLLLHTFGLAAVVALVVTIMMSLNPSIAHQRSKLLKSTGVQTIIQTIIPRRFRAVMSDQYVFYVDTMNAKHTKAQGVFVAKQVQHGDNYGWDILTAQSATARKDPQTGEEYLLLMEGDNYQGQPGAADYKIASFRQYEARLPHQTMLASTDIRTLPFQQLLPWSNPDLQKVAELQWRISIPLMVFTLTMLGVPLSRVNPRSGKYAKILPGVVLAFVYANFMFIARNWIVAGKIPSWLGMWWLHGIVILVGLTLLWRQRGSGS